MSMIDDATKKKLLKELAPAGNIYVACRKAGIGRATFYRWMKTDQQFNKLASLAIQNGKANEIDVAKHQLSALIREKNFLAIKFFLVHNVPEYQAVRLAKVIMEHWKKGTERQPEDNRTLEDLIIEADRKAMAEDAAAAAANLPPIKSIPLLKDWPTTS